MFSQTIIIAKISLHYEPRPTTIYHWTRERYAKELSERPKYDDWYFKRVTAKQADVIMNAQQKEVLKKAYSEAIQKKYNVGSNWEQNRWFVEQVRPTV